MILLLILGFLICVASIFIFGGIITSVINENDEEGDDDYPWYLD